MEIWKDIIGYEGLYQISDKGNVKSFRQCRKTNWRILQAFPNSKGYLRVPLKKDGKESKKFIHRLVAEAFVPNPDNKPQVNHLDCNPKNNCAENLEWVTRDENMHYMSIMGRSNKTPEWRAKIQKVLTRKYGKKVLRIDPNTNETKTYEFLNDVKRDGFQPSCVSNCCNHKRMSHKRYIWRFASHKEYQREDKKKLKVY